MLRRTFGVHLCAAVAFAVLAAAITWPLVLHLGTHIPGRGASDNVAFLWSFWWMREVLGHDAAPLFRTTALFHPFGTGLAMHTHAFSSAFVGATVLAGLSIAAAQNVVLLVSVALNGLVAYLLAWRLTRRVDAALVAGLYFAASPYFSGHLLGHFNLVPAWMLPLFALLWLRALDSRSLVTTACAGLVVGFTLWTDYYYTAYLLTFMAVSLACRWWQFGWTFRVPPQSTRLDLVLVGICLLLLAVVLVIRLSGGGVFFVRGIRISATTGLPPLTVMWALLLVWVWRRWRPVPRISRGRAMTLGGDLLLASVAGMATIASAWPILREAVRLWRSNDYLTPPGFLRSAAEGIDPVGLLAGNPFHVLWGHLVGRLYDVVAIDAIESTAWFGVAAIALALATRAFSRLPAEARLWRVTALVFLIWSLGPYLRVFGENTGLYLPVALLRLVPIANNIRIPGRAVVMVYLSVAMLLALAIATLPLFRTRWRVAAVAGLIAIDFAAAPLPLVPLPQTRVYQRLAQMPPGAVLELPMGIRDGFGWHGALDHWTLYFQTIHGKPLVGGFVARMPASLEHGYLESPLFGPLLALSEGASPVDGDDSLRRNGPAMLAGEDIRYVVLSRQAPPALRGVVGTWPLRQIAEDDDRVVFALD